ncbi:MAG: hypothetical protein C4308_10245 [Chitinophagaceae bacterium]
MTAGYTGTPLAKKLGIRPTAKILLIDAPPNYFEWFDVNIKPLVANKNSTINLVHLFATDYKNFEKAIKQIKPLIEKITRLQFGFRCIKNLLVFQLILLKMVVETGP